MLLGEHEQILLQAEPLEQQLFERPAVQPGGGSVNKEFKRDAVVKAVQHGGAGNFTQSEEQNSSL